MKRIIYLQHTILIGTDDSSKKLSVWLQTCKHKKAGQIIGTYKVSFASSYSEYNLSFRASSCKTGVK